MKVIVIFALIFLVSCTPNLKMTPDEEKELLDFSLGLMYHYKI